MSIYNVSRDMNGVQVLVQIEAENTTQAAQEAKRTLSKWFSHCKDMVVVSHYPDNPIYLTTLDSHNIRAFLTTSPPECNSLEQAKSMFKSCLSKIFRSQSISNEVSSYGFTIEEVIGFGIIGGSFAGPTLPAITVVNAEGLQTILNSAIGPSEQEVMDAIDSLNQPPDTA